MDLSNTKDALQARELDVAPIQDYAAKLARGAVDEGVAFDLQDGLSLREAQAVALWYNADLRIARLEAERSEAVAKASGRWLDPEIGLESGEKSVDSDGGSFLRDAGGTTRSWINAGALSITIPLSGRLRAEKRLNATAFDAALLRAAVAEWQLLGTVRDAWAHWSAAHARVELLDAHLALLGQFADTAASLAAVGELLPSSARLFAIECLRKEAERDREHAAEAEARFDALQLLGLLPDAPVTLMPALNSVTVTPTTSPLLEAHPKIALLRAEYQVAEDALRVELRKQYPDLTLSPSYANEESESAIVLGLGFPVPVRHANRPGIAEAAAARDLARARAEAGYADLITELAQAQASLDGSRAQRARLTDEVVPMIDTQMRESLDLLKVGEIDLVLVYEALSQGLDTKLELLNAALAEAIAASRLAAATAFDTVALGAHVETKQ